MFVGNDECIRLRMIIYTYCPYTLFRAKGVFEKLSESTSKDVGQGHKIDSILKNSYSKLLSTYILYRIKLL